MRGEGGGGGGGIGKQRVALIWGGGQRSTRRPSRWTDTDEHGYHLHSVYPSIIYHYPSVFNIAIIIYLLFIYHYPPGFYLFIYIISIQPSSIRYSHSPFIRHQSIYIQMLSINISLSISLPIISVCLSVCYPLSLSISLLSITPVCPSVCYPLSLSLSLLSITPVSPSVCDPLPLSVVCQSVCVHVYSDGTEADLLGSAAGLVPMPSSCTTQGSVAPQLKPPRPPHTHTCTHTTQTHQREHTHRHTLLPSRRESGYWLGDV